jgi:ferrous iron transport protein B
LQKQVTQILSVAVPGAQRVKRFNHHIDAVVMHPVWGLVLLAALRLMIFQAVFSWANVPMDAIKNAVTAVGNFTRHPACCKACWWTGSWRAWAAW